MKYILLLFIFLFGFTAYSQQDTVINKKDSISAIATPSKVLEKQEATPNQSKFQEDLINEYRHLITLYQWGFGTLLAIFGIVIPIITYFTQIKPAKEIIDEAKKLISKLEQDLEKTLEEHLLSNRDKLIDHALENIRNRNLPLIQNSLNVLEINKAQGFNEIQIIRIIKLLKSTDVEKENKEVLAYLLIYQEDPNTEDYFVDLIKKNPSDHNTFAGLAYFAKFNKQQYFELIVEVILIKDRDYITSSVVVHLLDFSKSYTLSCRLP